MLDRTKAPQSQELSNPKIPKTFRYQLKNDVSLITLNQGSQPIVFAEFVFPLGRYNEPLNGLAYYLFKMITEGTANKSANEIAETLDYFGSHLEIVPTLDHAHIKLYALHKFYRESIQIIAEMLLEASFPQKNFEIIQQIRVQQIKQQLAKNNAFASLKLREKLFGESHPYGLMMDEKLAMNIGTPELQNHKQLLLVKPQIFLAGNITDEILSITESIIGSIPFIDYSNASADSVLHGNSESIEREKSSQASIRLGALSMNRNHSDIHAFKVMNTLLGGYFGSRLMKNIREEKGLTYGIYSSLTHLQTRSYWHIGSEVLADKVNLAVDEVMKEINQLKSEPPHEEEINMVTSYLKGKYLMSFDTPFNSISMIKALYMNGLDESHLRDYYQKLNEITATEISETAQKHITEELTTVIVR